VSDATFDSVPGIERGLLTDRKPVRANSIAELAAQLGLDPDALASTVDAFNAGVRDDHDYDPKAPDGRATEGLDPAKSNWAVRIDTPPFVGIPLTTDIVFTYGGLATYVHGQVLGQYGSVQTGLFAACECTGIYYHKYPGATSVLRGLVYGRIAGANAAAEVLTEA
jgi:tricarballylate dehydrogenase